jgi:hypothetical protein
MKQPKPGVTHIKHVSGVSFLQSGAPTPGTNGVTHERVKCFTYNACGHYSTTCPTEAQEGVQMLQVSTTSDAEPYRSEFSFLQLTAVIEGFNFTQAGNGCNIIPSTWVLIDSQSTVSVFKNRNLVSNIRRSATEQ